MRSVINVSNIHTQKDVTNIRSALSNAEGIIACSIKIDQGIIDIVYNDYFIVKDEIEELIENMGYTVI